MPCVGHPWRKHFCDTRFIVMEVDTSVMIILAMSWNTSTTAQVWLSWFCHKFLMDVHAWQKTQPTVTNTYHHGSVFFCSECLCCRYLRQACCRPSWFDSMDIAQKSVSIHGWVLWCNQYEGLVFAATTHGTVFAWNPYDFGTFVFHHNYNCFIHMHVG